MDVYLSDFYLWVGWEPYSWFGLFFIASAVDAALTVHALGQGGYEANQVLRWLMSKTSAPLALFALKVPQAVLLFGSLQVNILYMPVIALMFVAACAWNVTVILRMRG